MPGIEKNGKNLKRIFVIAYMFLAAFLIVMVCSRSSFLYPFNNWVDVNCFFTVGKSMFNGVVLYRDIYEQKGPLLYFIYGVAYLMSHTSFIGAFFIEVVFTFVYMFALYKISGLYVGFIPSLVISALSVAVLCSSHTFYYGGSSEELCLPFAAIPMYFLLQCFKKGEGKIEWYRMLISGFCAGCVFLIKYTILNFAAVFVLFVIIEFLRRKNYKGLWQAALLYLAGAVISFIPWIIYLGVNGALDDFRIVYIYNNIFIYGKRDVEGNIIDIVRENVGRLRYYFGVMYSENILITLLFIAAFVWTALGGLKIKIFSMDRIYIPISCVVTFYFITMGSFTLEYYYTPVGVFAAFAFIAVYSIAEYIVKKIYKIVKDKKDEQKASSACINNEESCGGDASSETETRGVKKSRLSERGKRAVAALAACIIAVGGSVGLCFGRSENVYYMGADKSELFMFRFASIIEEAGGKTLLNYGCLDLGLYTAADIVPTCKYFCGLNIELDEIYETQNEFVAEGKVDFILSYEAYPDNIDLHYKLVSTDYRQYDGAESPVYLFENNSLIQKEE